MWSVRMRASRGEEHISGAEGLFTDSEVERAVRDYLKRADTHPRGRADGIHLSIEKLRARPREIAGLSVSTVKCDSTRRAHTIASTLLGEAGVSDVAVRAAFKVVNAAKTMRGAAVISATRGRRLEPDPKRGVRTSRIGVERRTRAVLARGLARQRINNLTVKEALALASKALALKTVVAELCVSDDPDYTTGYVATRQYGYVRIPNIKKKGSPRGGRVYFLKDGASLAGAVTYLESKPALVSSVSDIGGVITLDELLDRSHS
jgi:6-carboxyhexanoate--CoA ligase